MSLIICPDCGHEVSTTAAACPNCGHPFSTPVIERNVVIADAPASDGGFPTWAFIPLGILGIVLLFILFTVLSRDDDETANRTVNVNVAARRETIEPRETIRTQTQTVPPATDSQTITVPSTSSSNATAAPPSSATSVTTVPAEAPDTGTAVIDAKIATETGSPQVVKNEKFYLLDESLESILNDTDLEPLNGQTLINSFGLSVLYPDRYREFNREALRAINDHIKYDTLTDAGGKGQMKGVKPGSYYVFGVTKTDRGFAVWSSPVAINAGQNVLNLSPQRLTEMQE